MVELPKVCSVSIRVDPINGSDPLDVCHEMVRLASQLNVLVDADLNGVFVAAAAHSDPVEIHKEWVRRMSKAASLKNWGHGE